MKGLIMDNNDLIGSYSDAKTDLHQHLKGKRLEIWSHGKAERLCQMLSQSAQLRRIFCLWFSISPRATVTHKEQLSPAHYISFADVICRSVNPQAVNAFQRSAIDCRFHTEITPQLLNNLVHICHIKPHINRLLPDFVVLNLNDFTPA